MRFVARIEIYNGDPSSEESWGVMVVLDYGLRLLCFMFVISEMSEHYHLLYVYFAIHTDDRTLRNSWRISNRCGLGFPI